MSLATSSRAKRCPVCSAEYRASRRTCAHDGAKLEEVPQDPLIGTLLADTYRIEKPLGRGGMGELYVAKHERLGSRVAVKILHAAFTDHELALARFYREAEAMARIRSPYVASVLDASQTPDGRPCLIVELLDGEDLQARLRGGRISVDEALRIAVQVGAGLHAAHSVGVVHRDLKPSNILLDDTQGVAKIVDFGVAHLEGDAQLTQTGTVVGTPAYMAPEQIRGSSTVDGRADVYGVGAVLYRALTGQAPYQGTVPTSVLSDVLEHAPEPPGAIAPDIPTDVEALILRAMSRDPDTRFESADELRRAAERLRLRRARRVPWSDRGSPTLLGVLALATITLAAVAHPLRPSWAAWAFGALLSTWVLHRSTHPGPLAFRVFWTLVGAWSGYGMVEMLRPVIELPGVLAFASAALGFAVATQRSRSNPMLSPAPTSRPALKGSNTSRPPASSLRRPAIQTMG